MMADISFATQSIPHQISIVSVCSQRLSQNHCPNGFFLVSSKPVRTAGIILADVERVYYRQLIQVFNPPQILG